MCNPLKNDRPVSAGAAAAGGLGAISEDTAHSVQGWLVQGAAGWATRSIDATCATGGITQSRKGTNTHSGSGAHNVPADTCTSSARDAEQKYVAHVARAAKDVKKRNATDAV